MTHCVHIHTTRSRLSDRSANPELSQTHEHSNFRGCILIWNSAALLGRYLCSPLYHTNALQHYIIELKWNIFWISNILYSTLNDYYLPSPLLKLFSSFFWGGEGFKNLFILFKQHLFCQNVLTDFFWMDFFFFKSMNMTWRSKYLFPSIIFLIITVFHSRPEPHQRQQLCLSVMSMWLEALACIHISTGKAERNIPRTCITAQRDSFYRKKQYSIFKPEPLKLFSEKAC